MKSYLQIVTILCVCLGLLLAFVRPIFVATAPKVELRNEAGETIADIRIKLNSIVGTSSEQHVISVLNAGEASQLPRLPRGDFSAEISFELTGQEYNYDSHYVDLWPGDVGVFTIKHDGSVEFSYGARDRNNKDSTSQTSL